MTDTIISVLKSKGLDFTLDSVENGPRITRYIITLGKNALVKKFLSAREELILALGVESVRIVAPTPGSAQIFIEIPSQAATVVKFSDIANSEEFTSTESLTTVCLGKDVSGNNVISDIAKMPHLLIAGATGMGKSVAIHSIIASLISKADPDKLKLMLIDPKQVEFSAYDGIPHLITPVIKDPNTAVAALNWAIKEMERRYTLFRGSCARRLSDYNSSDRKDNPLPQLVIIIDELADLMLCAKRETEVSLMRLAQKARATGIYLIIGTQRPSPSVISTLIKANVPSKLCFKVATIKDSKTILDMSGAEQLLNHGDALFLQLGSNTPLRIQGAYISNKEIGNIVKSVKGIQKVEYNSDVSEYIKYYFFKKDNPILFDEEFRQAVDFAIKIGGISVSSIQRKLGSGYRKACRFVEAMENLEIIGGYNGNRPRDILMTSDEWKLMIDKLDN